jgi:DNA polymerase-1
VKVRDALVRADRASLDVETTDLNPLKGSLRVVQIGVWDQVFVIVTDPVIPLLLAYRGEQKGTSTYGQPMLDHWLSDEGRLHPSWMVLGTDTGRMSCTTVPFHGIPRESAYRSAIRAPMGRLIIKADYSQLQVRITAALAQDEAMLRLYHEGGDVHKATMAAILGKPISEVTDAERQLGKAIVFGLLFGSKAAGLRDTLNSAGLERNDFTLVEVSKMRKTFFEKWPGLRRRMEHPGNSGYAPRTIYDPGGSGRRRLDVSSPQEKLNTPVQQLESTGFKRALCRLYETRHEVPSARLIAAIHDEVVIEADAAEAGRVEEWLKRAMEEEMQAAVDATGTYVPIVVEVVSWQDWAGPPKGVRSPVIGRARS